MATTRVTTDRGLPAIERPLRPGFGNWPPAPEKGSHRSGIPVRIRVAYGVVAALALWLLLGALTPRPNLSSVQTAVQAVGSALLLVLATAAGFGLCRVPMVGFACTLTGMGLMLSPLIPPGPSSPALMIGGLAAFCVSGWAADALEFRGQC